jgi:3-phosphoshikimate 1-carboxyvinyltransferase (EC 2.5.1.19)
MSIINIKPASRLKGTVNIPSSKSIGHRAIICAALADGISRINNVSFSRDIKATCDVLVNLGKEITIEESSIIIKGDSIIKPTGKELFCDESGSTIRFLIPVALLQDNTVCFNGKGKLVERPFNTYYRIFEKQGIYY